VTLLRKAEFASIAIDVVEASCPRKRTPRPRRRPRRERRGVSCRSIGSPRAGAGGGGRGGLAADRRRALRALVGEEADERLAENAVHSVRALLDLKPDELGPREGLAALTAYVGEVRDLLLSEGHLHELVLLVRTLYETMRTASEACAPVLRTFGSGSSCGGSCPRSRATISRPRPRWSSCWISSGRPSRQRDRALGRGRRRRHSPDPAPARRALRRRTGDELLARLRAAPPRVASDLLRACARTFPSALWMRPSSSPITTTRRWSTRRCGASSRPRPTRAWHVRSPIC